MQTRGRTRQLMYIVAPAFLLLLCLGAINLAPRLPLAPAAPEPAVTAASLFTSPATATEFPATAIAVTPSPTAVTPLPTPTIPPDTVIELLGPPHGSAFHVQNSVVFYWTWPLPLSEDQRFAVYVRVNEQESLLGIIDEPNVGSSYRLAAAMTSSDAEEAVIQWQVRLETAIMDDPLAAGGTLDSVPLLGSELRSLTLISSSE